LCCSVSGSNKVTVPDSGSRAEKGPAGRPLDVDTKLTSQLKTQEKSIPEKWLVPSEVLYILFSV
jgi:hypothetical protein